MLLRNVKCSLRGRFPRGGSTRRGSARLLPSIVLLQFLLGRSFALPSILAASTNHERAPTEMHSTRSRYNILLFRILLLNAFLWHIGGKFRVGLSLLKREHYLMQLLCALAQRFTAFAASRKLSD